jgi:hypothetical protein
VHAAPAAASYDLHDHAVIHVASNARRCEDLDGFSLRQTKTQKRNAEKRVSGQTHATHFLLPLRRGLLPAFYVRTVAFPTGPLLALLNGRASG